LLVSVDLVSDELETMGEASSFYELAVLELLNLDVISIDDGAY